MENKKRVQKDISDIRCLDYAANTFIRVYINEEKEKDEYIGSALAGYNKREQLTH